VLPDASGYGLCQIHGFKCAPNVLKKQPCFFNSLNGIKGLIMAVTLMDRIWAASVRAQPVETRLEAQLLLLEDFYLLC
jgi:hypothetical protein